MDVPDTLKEGEKQVERSLNVLLGLSSSSRTSFTIKIIGYTFKVQITVLIDSGSTHSFINPYIVKILRLPV